MAADKLLYEHFEGHVGTVFTIADPALPPIALDLSEAKLLRSVSGAEQFRPPFSLLFKTSDPRVLPSYYVLPVFSSTFAGAAVVFFLLRLGYSRPLLLASFAVAVVWYYFVYFMIQRRQRLTIAVVPFGRVDSLYAIGSIDWQPLRTPVLLRDQRIVTADFDHDLSAEWERFLAECVLAGISVLHYKQLRQSLTGQVQMERLSENAFGSLVPSATYLSIKRAADFVIAVAAVPIMLVFGTVIAMLIKLDSRGPIFFRQTRIGYRGKPFLVWKFRTMRGSPAATSPDEDMRRSLITAARDARITRIGKWLRRSRIDEFPQLINILRGEMSWIGPRPEAAMLAQWYQAEIPFYRYRHVVRPGISGWAQVNQGHVAEINDVLKKLSYDFFYISRFGFWIDMLILARTLKTILTGFGSR